MEVFYEGEYLSLITDEEKLTLKYHDTTYEVVKIDNRYIIDSDNISGDDAIIYPAGFIKKNTEVLKKIKPYLKFISKYLHDYCCHVQFCNRCKFNIFNYLNEGNHGGWYNECDGYPSCSSDIYTKYEIECQRCDYGLCDDCEKDYFDEENLEFNILRNAIVFAANALCDYEEFDNIILDFPSKMDHIPKIIKWIDSRKYKESNYRNSWTFSCDYEMNRCKKYLESLY